MAHAGVSTNIESSEGQPRGCEGVWPACVLRCGLRPALGLVRGHCAWWPPFLERMPLGLPMCAPVSRGARVRAYALAVMGGNRPRRALTVRMVLLLVCLEGEFGNFEEACAGRQRGERRAAQGQGLNSGPLHNGARLQGGAPL